MDKSVEAAAVFDKYANEYFEKFKDVSLYTESFNFFCNSIKQLSPKVLEPACGPGNVTQYLINKRPDFKLLGIDLSKNMVELAKIKNPSAEFKVMDCRNISELAYKYDAMMCAFLFPYLTKEEAIKFICDAKGLLNNEGVLYLSTMENDYTKSDYQTGSKGDKVYINYHQEDYLIDTLKENGFSILYKDRKKNIMSNNIEVTDIVLISKLP